MEEYENEGIARKVSWCTDRKRQIIMFNENGSVSKPDIILDEDSQLRLFSLLLDMHQNKLKIKLRD